MASEKLDRDSRVFVRHIFDDFKVFDDLVASWGDLEVSWPILGCIGGILGPLWAILGSLWVSLGDLGASRGVLGAILGVRTRVRNHGACQELHDAGSGITACVRNCATRVRNCILPGQEFGSAPDPDPDCSQPFSTVHEVVFRARARA